MHEANAGIEFRRLQALHQSGLLRSQAVPELDEICRQAKEHFQAAMALVTLIDRDVQIVKAHTGTDVERTPRSVAFCDYTIRTDDVLVVPNATRDPRFAANPFVTGEPFIRFYAGAPLVHHRQIRLGALCLLGLKPRDFSPGDRAELMVMAEEVVSIIVAYEINSQTAKLRL